MSVEMIELIEDGKGTMDSLWALLQEVLQQ